MGFKSFEMKFITTLLMFALFGNNVFAQTDLDDLLETRWILNLQDGSVPVEDLEQLNFVTVDSPITEGLHMQFRYGGLTFKPNGLLIVHVWNKCGTGNPPNHYDAHWELITNTENTVLVISDTHQWEGKYFVQFVSPDLLKLSRIE